ncbi:MAG: tetratricopeptide repeat protein [Planctomycetes bacterium]|nr:tetratricopeptide repeat protein [Planctomycetota bacterium]
MARRRPIVVGLGIAALVGASPSRAFAAPLRLPPLAAVPLAGPLAAVPLAEPLPQARDPRGNARGNDEAAANDAYNFIAGLFEKGFHDQVVSEATKFLKERAGHPRAALVRYRLGQSLFELGKLKEAQAELARLEPPPAEFPYATEVSFRLAQCLQATGDAAAAARRFDPIARSDHYLAPAAAFHAGEAHFAAGAFASAAKAYALAAESKEAEYQKSGLHGLGWALYKAGEFAAATQALELFVQRHPQDATVGEAWFLLGECRLKQEQPAEALAAFQKVGSGEWFDDALSAAGFACAAQKDDARAAQWFLRLEQAVPDSPLLGESRLHAGIHLQRAGRDDEAAAVLDRLLAQGDARWNATACYWRGLVARRKGGPTAALPFFERGLAAKPEAPLTEQLALARADALFDAGDFAAAQEAYAKAGGGSEEAAYSAAVAALNGGDAAGAAQRAREMLQRFGKGRHAAGAQLILGEGLFAQQKWNEALPAFEAAAQAQGEGDESRAALRPRSLSRAGWCAYKLERHAPAAAHFAALATEFPQDERAPEAAFMHGRCLLRAGNHAAAEIALATAVQQHGKSEWGDDARYDLAQCKRALGKGDEADALLVQLARGGGKVDAALARRAALEAAEGHAAAGRHAEALKLLAGLVRDANAPLETRRAALYAQAWSLEALGVHGEARDALQALFASETKEAALPSALALPALELAATVARAAKDPAGARAAWTRFSELAPQHERAAEIALVAALALDENDDSRGAAQLLGDALQRLPKAPGRERLVYQRALSLQAAGEVAEANALLATVAASSGGGPLAAQAAFELGEQAYAKGDYEGALAHYQNASGVDSPVADAALYKSGWARFQQERFGDAASCFARLVKHHEKSALVGESRYLQGESLYRAGAFEPALQVLEEFLAAHPKHEQRSNGLFRAGLCAGELGRLDAAFDALTRLQREFPDFALKAEADLWLGRALFAKQRTNDALAKFDAVLQADRGVLAARAHLGRGEVLQAQGRLDDALSEFLKVALLFDTPPEVARALWGAGQCLEAQGDVAKAKARYAELVEKHADAAQAGAAKARLRELEAKKS